MHASAETKDADTSKGLEVIICYVTMSARVLRLASGEVKDVEMSSEGMVNC